MAKKRLFYLDFVRAIAVVLILITHFNVPWLPMPTRTAVVVTTTVGGIYIGDFGVSLFLIISGAALFYVYRAKCDVKKFFFKRFKSIYPMFWIAFIIGFVFRLAEKTTSIQGIPKSHILYSVFGMDMLASSSGILTFATVGEWFLGLIIFLYLCFPLLRWLVLRAPKATAIVSILIYVLLVLFYHGPIPDSCFILFRLPEFLFGMYFIQYIKKVPPSLGLATLVVLILNEYFKIPINSSVATTLLGICGFLTLVYFSKFFAFKPVEKVASVLCALSYPIFLVHHYIYTEIFRRISLSALSPFQNYLLFFICIAIVLIVSKMLDYINSGVLHDVGNLFSTKDKIPSHEEGKP